MLKYIFNRVKSSNVQIETKFESIRDQGTKILQQDISPDKFSKLESRIRVEFSLYHRWHAKNAMPGQLENEIAAVKKVAGLARVFMFHGDGRVREAALNNLTGPLIAPANVYALFWRMNDWSPIVRDTAKRALQRCLPTTPAIVIYPALKALLPAISTWGRWSAEGPESVNEILMRQDIAELVCQDLLGSGQSGLGQLFREICSNSYIDQQLETILVQSPLPHIRAMALEMLISGQAKWPTRTKRKVWIDKSMNVYRLVPKFKSRDLTIKNDIVTSLRIGAQDKASIVRKRTADGLIAHRKREDIRKQLEEISEILIADKNYGVQTRMDFLNRKREEERFST